MLGFFFCVLAAFGWVYWQLLKYGHAIDSKTFVEYVSGIYIPKQRRLTGRWPSNLEGLPQFLLKNDNGSGQSVSRYYKDDFINFQPLKQGSKQYRYQMKLRYYTVTCVSSVNSNDGFCDYHE